MVTDPALFMATAQPNYPANLKVLLAPGQYWVREHGIRLVYVPGLAGIAHVQYIVCSFKVNVRW